MRPLILTLCCLTLATACGGSLRVDDGVFPLPGDSPENHRLRYRDGQVSDNDTCMVRVANRLNARIPPAYVNGQPLGFC